jgi:hypothetical protein
MDLYAATTKKGCVSHVGQKAQRLCSITSTQKLCERLHWFDVGAQNLKSG